ncbi:MAG TPA: hypothetical protein VFB58_19215 [Chloroflexota bacterium]|nr:hypothetical protein [Chloroflexota bacterium]
MRRQHNSAVLIVAGLSLKNLNPRVWDPESPYYMRALQAVMVSYADFHAMPARRKAAMEQGLHASLGIPFSVRIFLDNGAFYFINRHEELPVKDYEEFVAAARPDWYPIPRDYIPTPGMPADQKHACFTRTMEVNRAYEHDGYVPVIHIGEYLETYTTAICEHPKLAGKPAMALGGIVPNLLRTKQAMAYADILTGLLHMRSRFADKSLHVFGIGGTATIHIAALLGLDSVDSAGWRNRAARGIVQLPGSGDRMMADLGKWRGRRPSDDELSVLDQCRCPACQVNGMDGLRASGTVGFCYRATHNLWVLLEEAGLIDEQLTTGTYVDWYAGHISNSIYRPLIDQLLSKCGHGEADFSQR